MKRFFIASRKGLLARRAGRVALGASVLTAAAGIGLLAVPSTFGAGTTQASNPGNAFTTGTLLITAVNNSPSNTSYIIQASKVVPGGTATGTVTVSNVGSEAAYMLMTLNGLTSTTSAHPTPCPTGVGTTSPTTWATLGVTDPAGTVVTTGTLASTVATGSSIPDTYSVPGSASPWAAGESHVLTFTVTFPKTGGTAENAYQGTSATFAASFSGCQGTTGTSPSTLACG